MALVIGILLLVMLLGALIVTYLSSKAWHWGHVLLMLTVFVASLGFLVLSAETVRIHDYYGARADQLSNQLSQLEKRIGAARDGTGDSSLIAALNVEAVDGETATEIQGTVQLDHELHLLTRRRGRVWRNVVANPAQPIDPETGAVEFLIESPNPHGIDTDTMLFLFEQGAPDPSGDQGANYLGEFRVVSVGEGSIVAQPVIRLTQFETDRIAMSQKPWALYETMPADSHELFEMEEDELRGLLPESTVEEYIRHGGEANDDDEALRVVGYDAAGGRVVPGGDAQVVERRYERRLRDYAFALQDLGKKLIVALSDVAAVKQDNARLDTALASAKRLGTYREDEIEKLRSDLSGVQKDVGAASSLLKSVQRELTTKIEQLTDIVNRNNAITDELRSRALNSS